MISTDNTTNSNAAAATSDNTPTKSYHRHQKTSIKERCRLCGEEKQQLQKVFSKIGKSKNLKEKISKYCGVDITETEKLSTLICKPCESFVNKISIFQENCKRVNQSGVLVKKRCVPNKEEFFLCMSYFDFKGTH